MVEYAIIIALLAVVSLIGVRGLGDGNRNLNANNAAAATSQRESSGN